jgi:hypothetical protein
MCSICGCELPRHRDGHVTKATIKAHNRGQKHSVAKDRCDEEDAARFKAGCTAMRVRIEHDALARERKRIESINSTSQALLLSVVATRLCAAHGSMHAARTAWAVESDAALNQLESSALKAALWRSAAAHVARQHILRAASDAWLVVELVINVAVPSECHDLR